MFSFLTDEEGDEGDEEEEDQSKTRPKGTSKGPPAKRTKTLKA